MQKRVRYVVPVVLATVLGLAGCQSGLVADRSGSDHNGTATSQPTKATTPFFEIYVASLNPIAGMREFKVSDRPLYVQSVPVLVRADLESVDAMADQQGNSFVGLRFNDSGARKLESISRQYQGELLAVFVNRQLVAAPSMQVPLDRGVMAFQVGSSQDAQAIAAAIRGDESADTDGASQGR